MRFHVLAISASENSVFEKLGELASEVKRSGNMMVVTVSEFGLDAVIKYLQKEKISYEKNHIWLSTATITRGANWTTNPAKGAHVTTRTYPTSKGIGRRYNLNLPKGQEKLASEIKKRLDIHLDNMGITDIYVYIDLGGEFSNMLDEVEHSILCVFKDSYGIVKPV